MSSLARWNRVLLTCALTLPAGYIRTVLAAGPVVPSASEEAELSIPTTGPVRRGEGRRVQLTARDGSPQVALLHAEVGDCRLVIMPNGRLQSRTLTEAPITDAPFKPATKDQLAAELKAGDFAKFKTRNTVRYVYTYNTSEEFYKGASRILETMYPAILSYFKKQKFPVHDPATPLVAILFRTEEEFRAFEHAPPGVAAYYDAVSNRIVMYEQSKLVARAPELALKQAIGTIAHEGIHHVLHNIGVQERLSRWPMWVCEGLAEYFAPTDVNEQLRWKGVGMPNDLRIYELDKVLKQSTRKPGQLVRSTVEAGRLTSAGYASAWALTHYLATKKKDKFYAYLREVSTLGPLEPREQAAAVKAHRELFERHFGSDYETIETALFKHLESLPYVDPIANQTHYVVMLGTPSSRSARVTTSPVAVEQWQESVAAELDPVSRQQATFQILPFENRATAEEYAKAWAGK